MCELLFAGKLSGRLIILSSSTIMLTFLPHLVVRFLQTVVLLIILWASTFTDLVKITVSRMYGFVAKEPTNTE